jgi:hypothetical protein
LGRRRRSARRGAVVALGAGLAVALAVQLAAGWAIHTNRMPLRDPTYTDKFDKLLTHPGFTQGAGPRKLMFIGSSRTLAGINAGAVEASLTRQIGRPVAAFNFGIPGAGPITNAVYLRRLLADGVKPDAVVLEVHPLLLAAQTALPPEAPWFPTTRLRPDELPLVRRFGFPAAAPAAHGYRGWLLPLHEYRVPFMDRYATPLSVTEVPQGVYQVSDSHGFVRGREVPLEERPKQLERARRQYALLLAGYQPGGCEVAALRDSLEACRGAGIPCAVVLAPESSEFRGWYPEAGLAQFNQLLRGLAGEFACPVIDAREWLPDEQLGDGHHPTGSGADAFTDRLTREVLATWLASAHAGGAQ